MNKSDLEIIIKDILNYLEADTAFEIKDVEENIFNVDIEGDDLSYLIGYHGNTLNAFQHIVNSMVFNKHGENIRVNIDINNYKGKRADKIKEIAKKYIDKARFFDEEIHMPPMTAWERRHVHMLLSEYADIESESTGEGEDRHIILKRK